jgi:protein tyrosine phosphatase (PTP) superfamily phosphohydrolase (DUF442 family)
MSNDFNPVKVTAPIVTAGQNCWRIGDFYISAQPTEAGLTAAHNLGIKSVICLRDALEVTYQQFLPFDPQEDRTLTTTLGMSFVNIPFPHSPTNPSFNIPQDQFNIRAGSVLAVLNQLPRPLLMHCSSGDRASALWAVHLIVNCGLTTKEAMTYATKSGLAVFAPYVQKYTPPKH